MKINVINYADPQYNSVSRITTPNHAEYCARNNYSFNYRLIHESPYWNLAWEKFYECKTHLPCCDWLMWIDCDTLFMNMNKRLEGVIEETAAGKNFIVAEDPYSINTGVFFLRNCQWSFDFLTTAEAMYDDPERKHAMDADQGAVIKMLENEKWSSQTSIVHQRHFNSYWNQAYGGRSTSSPNQFQQGDLLVHIPGILLEHRIMHFHELLKMIER